MSFFNVSEETVCLRSRYASGFHFHLLLQAGREAVGIPNSGEPGYVSLKQKIRKAT